MYKTKLFDVNFTDLSRVIDELFYSSQFKIVQLKDDVIEFEAPGLTKDSIEVSLNKTKGLIIKAKTKQGKDYLTQLPGEYPPIEGGKVLYEDGIITILFKRKEEEKQTILKVT